MAKLEHSVVINRPLEEVFKFLSNPENEQQRRSGLLEPEITSEEERQLTKDDKEASRWQKSK
jgi:carbon monoxide dehydrogenase subunit G